MPPPHRLPAFADLNIAPGRVIFRRGALRSLVETLLTLGDTAGVVATDSAFSRLPSFGPVGVIRHRFGGETTPEEIDRACETLAGSDVIVGVGGGKALDTAKACAHDLRRPCVAVPTSAATCAAMTALVVVYDADGRFREYRYANTPPAVALGDADLLAATPDRLLAAGLADGVAKWVETLASAGRDPDDHLGVLSLDAAARALAVYRSAATRRAEGDAGGSAPSAPRWRVTDPPDLPSAFPSALSTVERADGNGTRGLGSVTPAGGRGGAPASPSPPRVAVAFANLVLSGLSSGIGGMSSFATLTHALANGLTRVVSRPGALLHGEWVAPLLLEEMRMIGCGAEEVAAVDALFLAFGLPRTAAELASRLGAPIPRAAWEAAVAYALAPGETATLSRHRYDPAELIARFSGGA